MTQKVRLQIDGMTCQACASRIEKVLNKKSFVQQASVNFANEEAQIEFDDSQTNLAALIHIIEKTGLPPAKKPLLKLIWLMMLRLHGDYGFY